MDFRIAALADIVIAGTAKPHGVARFLDDLGRHLPADSLRIFVPAKSGVKLQPHLHGVDAPHLELPGLPQVQLAHPLAHHRKAIRHQLESNPVDVLHVSTPGPFGFLGRSLAAELKLPLVGIDHTRFDRYVAILVEHFLRQTFSELAGNRGALSDPAHPWNEQVVRMLGAENALRVDQIIDDMAAIRDLPNRPKIAAIRRSPWQRLRWFLARWWVPGFRELEEMKDRVVSAARRAGELLDDVLPNHRRPDEIGDLARQITDAYLRWFYKDFTLLLARSDAELPRVQQLVSARRTRVLRPGIDTQLFSPSERQHGNAFWRAQGAATPDDAAIVLYVGRVALEKNLLFLTQVCKLLSTRPHSNFHFVLVGPVAPDAQRQFDNALKDDPASARFHCIGSLHDETLINAYRNADIFVFPSLTETLGQVLLEAMSTGLPAIAANAGGPKAILGEAKQAGALLPASELDDAELWMSRISEWADHPTARLQVGRNARQHVETNFSWPAAANSYQSLHEEAVRLQQRSTTRRARKRVSLSQIKLPEPQWGPGMLVLSDYHAGKKKRQERPLQRLAEFATQHQLDVCLLGDFADHSSHLADAETDFEVFRKAAFPTTRFIRGNHDYGFDDDWLEERLQTPIYPSYVHVDETQGVFSTHGHILGLVKELEQARLSPNDAELEMLLSPERLDEVLKAAIVSHDISSLCNDHLNKKGLSLLRIWEAAADARGELAKKLAASNTTPTEAMNMLAHLLVPREDSEQLAKLAAHSGCWLGVFGHTHQKDIRVHQEEGRDVFIANSGKCYGKKLSCVLARFPEVFILQWSDHLKDWEIWRQQRLTESAQTAYVAIREAAGA